MIRSEFGDVGLNIPWKSKQMQTAAKMNMFFLHETFQMRLATGEITNSTSLFTVYVTVKCIQGVSIATVIVLYFCVVTTLWRKQVMCQILALNQ